MNLLTLVEEKHGKFLSTYRFKARVYSVTPAEDWPIPLPAACVVSNEYLIEVLHLGSTLCACFPCLGDIVNKTEPLITAFSYQDAVSALTDLLRLVDEKFPPEQSMN